MVGLCWCINSCMILLSLPKARYMTQRGAILDSPNTLAAKDGKCSSDSHKHYLKRPLKRGSGQADSSHSPICVTQTYHAVLSPLLSLSALRLSTDREAPAACSPRSWQTSGGRLTPRREKEQPHPLLQASEQRCLRFVIKMLLPLVFKHWCLLEKARSTPSPLHLSAPFSAVTSL